MKLEEKMKREGKTIEDAITNKFVKENDEAVSDDERYSAPSNHNYRLP